MRTAAIGIGSNSLRMLVADISDGKLNRLRRYREGLRVFAALDKDGNITQEMILNACQSVERFYKQALEEGANPVHLFATSAVRDATNQQAFAQALKEATGLVLDVCSGDLEAQLSFLGATNGGFSGLIDIGGGSTEVVIGKGLEVSEAASLQMGAVRLCRMHPIQSIADAYRVVCVAGEILAPKRDAFCTYTPETWIGVGGTFTTGAALVKRVAWDNREGIHGFLLTRDAVQAAMEQLAPMPLEERLTLPYLQPQRADIVVHGMAILLACMQGLHIPCITVSEYGNLEGYLKIRYLCASKS